jgi:hypothetical protein
MYLVRVTKSNSYKETKGRSTTARRDRKETKDYNSQER